MKSKITFATTLTTLILFFILTSVRVPFLFVGAFVLLVARGLSMYFNAISDSYEINEDQPKENLFKLLIVRLFLQLIPIAYIMICLYIFFQRKEVWLNFF